MYRDFAVDPASGAQGDPLTDAYGHGSHVAGIIAGGLPSGGDGRVELRVAENVSLPAVLGTDTELFDLARLRDRDAELVKTRELEQLGQREVADPIRLDGIARRCRLVSLKVLNEQGTGRSSDVIRALRYVREDLNQDGRKLVVHGVNLSLGYDFNAKAFACGQTPICVEVNRLVQSGVVAVAAAGNTGHGTVTGLFGQREGTLLSTINDPGNAAEAITVGSTHRDMPHVYGVSWFSSKGPTGNAERAITVGSTHRDMPHTYGVSYFSSKGPTADGRPKPDLVAPGEQIASCAAGGSLKLVYGDTRPPAGHVTYVTDSGTAMACAHVSGAVAAFLSVHREFLGRPDDTKRIFLENATSLGRTAEFQGRGLVDLMRALQAV